MGCRPCAHSLHAARTRAPLLPPLPATPRRRCPLARVRRAALKRRGQPLTVLAAQNDVLWDPCHPLAPAAKTIVYHTRGLLYMVQPGGSRQHITDPRRVTVSACSWSASSAASAILKVAPN